MTATAKRDILQRVKEVIHTMRPVTEGQTQAKAKAVKWYLSLNMNPVIKKNPAVTFPSEVFKSIDTHELNYQFRVGYNQNVKQIDELQHDCTIGPVF